jgi:hypothetical protein
MPRFRTPDPELTNATLGIKHSTPGVLYDALSGGEQYVGALAHFFHRVCAHSSGRIAAFALQQLFFVPHPHVLEVAPPPLVPQ